MRIATLRRGAIVPCALLLMLLGLLLAVSSAQADPGTASDNGMTLTVSDTTPAPGQTLTLDFSYNTPFGNDGADTADMGYLSTPSDVLDYVSGSCSGDFSGCATVSNGWRGDVPPVNGGLTVSGSATFRVPAGKVAGDLILLNGFHESLFGTKQVLSVSPAIPLVVTDPPPTADLGVALSATAGAPLSGSVNYDAAVTNHGPAAATSATITTQLSTHATSIASSTCTFSSTTHQVSCPIGALANSATTHATFTAYYGLLTIGLPLNATATRTTSAPTDPNAANDSDGANCTALTSLLITC